MTASLGMASAATGTRCSGGRGTATGAGRLMGMAILLATVIGRFRPLIVSSVKGMEEVGVEEVGVEEVGVEEVGLDSISFSSLFHAELVFGLGEFFFCGDRVFSTDFWG